MPYTIETFKAAFGYQSGVVDKLVEVLGNRLNDEPENVELKALAEAVELQAELLKKEARAKELSGIAQSIEERALRRQIAELKLHPKRVDMEDQLKLLEDLHQAEAALASNTNPMLGNIIQKRVARARLLLKVPKDFTTISESTTTVGSSKPSLDSVLRGGGELELDKVYKSGDGKSYKVTKAITGGGHSAFKIVDEETNKAYLWKPAASEMMLQAEIGASKLSGVLMPKLCPSCDKVTIDGRDGTCQPFVEGCEELGDVTTLTETQQEQMVAHMLTDWLISNHDNHLKQFMVDGSGDLIGIDKGQAFKHFKHGDVESQVVKTARKNLEGKLSEHERQKNLSFVEPEHLSVDYWPKSNIGMPASGDFMKSMASSMRQPDFSTGVVAETVQNAKNLTLEDVRKLFGEYAKLAFPDQEEAFLKAVLDRAHHMDEEVQRLQFSAPATADHHLEQVNKLLKEDNYVAGSYPQIAEEIGSLRKAIMALKKVEGIESAKKPDPKAELYEKLKKLEAAYEKLAKIDDDCKACEKYLSSDYRRVSPLLAAFEAQKVDPAVHCDPSYKYDKIEAKLLEDWKRIAVERKLGDEDGVLAWDASHLADTYEIVRSMHRAWEAFPPPEIPDNKVARGDVSEHLFKNYPQLDPDNERSPLTDGEHNVNIQLTWPGVMSTTVGKPTEHNFIAEKTFIWSFAVQEPCPGRVIGDINPSEQEVTFPIGVKVSVTKLIIRKENKTLRSGDFGSNAIVIAEAKLG